jgi:hypothetical protein
MAYETYEEFSKKLKSGKIAVSQNSEGSYGYQDATFTISKAAFIPHSKLPEGMQRAMNPNGVYWGIEAEFLFADGTKKQHEFYSPALTKKGDVACYPSSDQFTGTLLHDIIEGAKKHDPAQYIKGWMDNVSEIPAYLESLTVAMRAKLIKDGEYLIAETSYQKKKDAEYASRDNSAIIEDGADVVTKVTGIPSTTIDPNDLPF